MKRVHKMLSLLLTAILLFLVPVAAEEDTFRPDWQYDNSFVVTVETPEEHSFVFEDFPELTDLADLVSMSKEKTETGYLYDLVMVLNTPGEDAVQTAMAAVAENEYVTEAVRNYYIFNSADLSADIIFTTQHLYVPLGRTASVGIQEVKSFGYTGVFGVGIDFTIDPAIIDDSYIKELGLTEFGISRFRAFDDTLEIRDFRGFCAYSGVIDVRQLLRGDETVLYQKSDTNHYFGEYHSDTIQFQGDYALDPFICHAGALDILTRTPGFVSVRVIGANNPTGGLDYEYWSVEGEKAIVLKTEGEREETSSALTPINCTAEILGKELGYDRIKVERRTGFSVIDYCDITVYLPGDVNQNEKVDAADALQVLKHTVGKITLEQETVAYHAADVTEDTEIDPSDALAILRIVVS